MRVKRHVTRGEHLRRALAQEAARLMAEHGIRDFLVAKRKAAERFGVVDGAAMLPKNSEIESALAEYQRLFGGASHLEALHAQRHAALSAMRYLREFSPRLVGAVLSGTATLHTEVQLHLFADRVESVALKLLDAGIPHEVTEKRVKLCGPFRACALRWTISRSRRRCSRPTVSAKRRSARWTGGPCGARMLSRSRPCCSSPETGVHGWPARRLRTALQARRAISR